MHRNSSLILFAGTLLLTWTAPLRAQLAADSLPPLSATPRFPSDRFVDGRLPLELDLSRPLRASGERLALTVGNVDVSHQLEVSPSRVRYRPGPTRLPSGEREVVLYLVTGGDWREVGRFPLKVRSRAGLDQRRLVPSIDLSSTGQLDRGGTAAIDPSARRTYQDFTLRIGFESMAGRDGTELVTAGNLVGVSEENQRLRFGEMQGRAPALDLADYRITLGRRGLSLSVGNLATGQHRQLISGFASRGVGGSAKLGGVATLEAAFLNGTNVVGWNNLLGLTLPNHRIGSANLALELQPRRPGSFRIDLSGMDGAMLPLTGFTQGAVTDAEESRGYGGQLAWSDSRQRVQLTAGIARSRFVNPNDPLLAGDSTLVSVAPTTRTARFGNLNMRLINDLGLSRSVRAGLGLALRHERVDPLYRSLGAGVQADLETNGADLSATVGALSVQLGLGTMRDNLGEVASILTTKTDNASQNLALPIGALFKRADRWWFPQLSYQRQRTHQRGEGVPTNGDFSAGHVPDQVSVSQSGSLTWNRQATQFGYRWSQSFQDNRQTGRERSDFRAIVHGLSLGVSASQVITLHVDASVERQKLFETGVTQRLERLGGGLRWQPWRATELATNLTQSWGLDPSVDQRTRNTEFQIEASQGFDLYRRTEAGKQARLFVRFGRTRAARHQILASDLLSPDVQWTLYAGGSIRLY